MKTIFKDYVECPEAKKMIEAFNKQEDLEDEGLDCECEDCLRTGRNIMLFEMYYPNIKRFDIIKKKPK